MKLLRLKVKNVRGIRDLDLELAGKNVVIWGPNGAGKSGVVDAIQFLFSGKMSRLEGPGTSGLNLGTHGPHVGHQSGSAVVTGVVSIDGLPTPIEIERRLDRPKILKSSDSVGDSLELITNPMKRGGVVLTRRDILRYVTAEAGTRATDVQNILNLKSIEDVRKNLVGVNNSLKRELKSANQAVTKQEAAVNVHLGAGEFSDAKLAKIVNENSEILGGKKLDVIEASAIQCGLRPTNVMGAASSSVNTRLTNRVIEDIRQQFDVEAKTKLEQRDETLRTKLSELKSDPELLAEFELFGLTKHARRFVDESTTKCPVCDVPWPVGDLQAHLDTKIVVGRRADAINKRIESAADAIDVTAKTIRAKLNSLIEDLVAVGVDVKDGNLTTLESWRADLDALISTVENPMTCGYERRYSKAVVARLCAPKCIDVTMKWVVEFIREVTPVRSPEQTAWDLLTRLGESVSTLQTRRNEHEIANTTAKCSQVLHDSFVQARNSVLDDLYTRVSDRFVEFYSILHEHERSNFGAKLQPRQASLDFKVDFMGKGTFPPHAVHSEGHQDSMGLCLFLALNEELADGAPTMILLDDVMMSVDAGHRRDVCLLLKQRFPDCQFLITTHDKTWVTQLRHGGVVDQRQVIEFTGWSLETGPITRLQKDLWEDISADLEQDDVNSAAFKLRRGSEDFFESVCDALGAKITYKSTMTWELRDWLFAAMDRYRQLLKQALGSARSWENEHDVMAMIERESQRKQVYGRTYAEHWAINPNVHYNNWVNMSKQDFEPVVEAFSDLQALFECVECGSLIGQVLRNGKPEVVKCECSRVTLNLRRNPSD